MNEYWLVLKYKMSGLKLLAEIAAMSIDVKEKSYRTGLWIMRRMMIQYVERLHSVPRTESV